MGDRNHPPRKKRPRVGLLGGVGTDVYGGGSLWCRVARVREWCVWYVGHRWQVSLGLVFCQPWDAWSQLSPSEQRSSLVSFLRRLENEGTPTPSGGVGDKEFSATYPALTEYLTCERYPDGSPREKATLSVFHEDGLFKMCINERDQGLVLFVAEERFSVLLEALELVLQEDRPPWRKSKAKGPSGSTKRGKGS